MTITTRALSSLQYFFEIKAGQIKDNEHYQKLMALPPLKRWGTIAVLFVLFQLIVFSVLYLVFGKIVVDEEYSTWQ